ncbi:MAG: hypothetical protein WCG80_15575 [Spirochaetales bacterium]
MPLSSFSNKAGFSIRLGSTAAKTLLPTLMSTWSIKGDGPDGASFGPTSLASDSAEASVTDLVPGDWTIVVSGFDAAGTEILAGSADATLEAGQANAVTITLATLTNVNLTVSVATGTDQALTPAEAPDNVLSVLMNSSVVLTAPSGFDTYQWFVDGLYPPTTPAPPNVYTYNAYSSGRHRIQIVASKNGDYYSDEVLIEVGGS